jgi:single-strand DNA-binding protein
MVLLVEMYSGMEEENKLQEKEQTTMNKLTIIGNLTRDPELRTTSAGVSVCSFTVAVNRRNRNNQTGQADADFFRVSAWRERGETCAKYLTKGKKVCVIGPVSVKTYQANDGTTKASLEVTADEVEFLSSRDQENAPEIDQQSGYEKANVDDELPFPV